MLDMTWLRSKTACQTNYCMPEYIEIPKNPVFYPPTHSRDHTAARSRQLSAGASRSRSGRLLSRLKGIFTPHGNAGGPDLESTTPAPSSTASHSGDGGGRRRRSDAGQRPKRDSKYCALGQPRLLARSPLCENSISPDLRALADAGYFPPPSSPPSSLSPSSSSPSPSPLMGYKPTAYNLYSSTIFYTRSKARPQNWSQFSGSAYSSKRSSVHILDSTLMPSLHNPGDVRLCSTESSIETIPSVSLDLGSIYSLHPLIQLSEAAEDCDHECRASYGSESTARSAVDTHANVGCFSSSKDGSSMQPPNEQLSCVHSQRTVHGDDGFIRDASQLKPCCRRPYSDDFAKYMQLLGGCFREMENVESWRVPVDQRLRAMYIRSSCTDSGFVKSAFDLAKLLPNTPDF